MSSRSTWKPRSGEELSSQHGFEEVPLEAPPAESHPQERLCFIVADGSTSDGKRKDGAKAEFVHTVPEEVNRMRGKALSAAVIEDKVVISYGVHGCGFMWQNGFLLIVDLKEKSSKNVEVELDCDSPNFCAIGAKAHALLSNGDWIHAVGSIRQGMTGSLYDGKTFALVDALTKPRWAKLGVEVPEDEKSQVVIDPATNTVYVASTNAQIDKVAQGRVQPKLENHDILCYPIVKTATFRSYKHIIILHAVIGQGYSTVVGLIVPYCRVSKGEMIMFSVGPFDFVAKSSFFTILNACLHSSAMMLVCYSFVVQYFYICRPNVLMAKAKTFYTSSIIASFYILLNWNVIIYLCFCPQENIDKGLAETLNPNQEFLRERAILAISNQYFTPLSSFLIVEMFVILFLVGAVTAAAANRILLKIRSDMITGTRQKHYANIFRMLLIQCIAPALFCVFPTFCDLAAALLGLDIGSVLPIIISITLPTFPIFNVSILIFQIKDYRGFVFGCFKQVEKKTSTVRTNSLPRLSLF
ncbi:unnamed protein product [Caenorhabditis auriculariae]|uniref:G protein-coupled receptor n=1 Tax=Caenorhabditis auriculariae TaxID=2777116 RepID=A0A8S1HU71_9PELO|nr:unnamed protein product [Caenorhabditis auriculariae]